MQTIKEWMAGACVVAALCSPAAAVAGEADTVQVAAAAAATTGLPQSWSYSACVEYARANNIDLHQSRLTRESSGYDLEAARGQWLPTFNFSTSHSLSNYPSPAGGNFTYNESNGTLNSVNKNTYNGSYGITGGWTVFNGNQRRNNIKRSELQNDINDMAVEQMANSLETQILNYYLQILYSREAIEIARQTMEVSEAQMKRGEELMKAGKMSRVDYVQLESQWQTDRYNVVTAESTYETNKMQLKQLLELGIEYDMQIDSIAIGDGAVLQPLPDKAEVYNMAIAWLPEVRQSALQGDMSELDVKIAQSGYMPTISLNGSVGTGTNSSSQYSFGSQMKHNFNEQIGITLSMPIFDGKQTKTEVAKARASKLSAILDYRGLLNDVAQTIETAYLDARNSQAQYVSGKETVRSAALTDELTNEQFRLGLVNTLDLLSSHNSLLTARLQLLQAKYMALLNLKMLDYYQNKGITLP